MQNDCAEFKIRAERKAGEFLKNVDLKNGFKGNQHTGKFHDATRGGEKPYPKKFGKNDFQSGKPTESFYLF